MRPQPYIGITGFSSRSEVTQIVAARPIESECLLMVGMLMSHKSLHDEPVDKPKRYPKREVVPSIFMRGKNLLNLVHFNTKNPELLADDMLAAHKLAGRYCHGFQLNMAWPDAAAIKTYRSKYRRATIVLQCGASALEEVREDDGTIGEKFLARVAAYGSLINYVLIDQSGGQGLMFNALYVEQCFTLLSTLPNIGLVVAGGLQTENLHSLQFLRRKFGDFSFDAESNLRDKNDELSMSKVIPYLKVAEAVSTQRRRSAQAA